jgi:hypothetical protein
VLPFTYCVVEFALYVLVCCVVNATFDSDSNVMLVCSLPLGSPIWGFTAHVGGRTPSRVHTSPLFLFFGCLSVLRLHVSHVGIPVSRLLLNNKHQGT